jgi:hypothetical protein
MESRNGKLRFNSDSEKRAFILEQSDKGISLAKIAGKTGETIGIVRRYVVERTKWSINHSNFAYPYHDLYKKMIAAMPSVFQLAILSLRRIHSFFSHWPVL